MRSGVPITTNHDQNRFPRFYSVPLIRQAQKKEYTPCCDQLKPSWSNSLYNIDGSDSYEPIAHPLPSKMAFTSARSFGAACKGLSLPAVNFN